MGVSKPTARGLWAKGLRGATAVTAVNVAVLLAGRGLGIPFEKPAWDGRGGPMAVTPGEVIFVSVVTFMLGIALASVLSRREPARLRYALTAATAFTLLSLAGPLSLGTDAATKAGLAAMHVVSGVGYVMFVRRAMPRAASASSASAGAPTLREAAA